MRILVTGAASGLGAALTRAWRLRGDDVLATDLAGDDVDLTLDVTNDDDWATAFEEVQTRWGGLDILVNNAGVAGGGRLDVATLDEWRWITEINLFGVVRGTRTFVPLFKRQRSGHIVNVASLAGLVHPAGMASYNAVKAAVVALTETTGHELAAYGVRASVVCPSYFRTNLLDVDAGSRHRPGRRDGTPRRVLAADRPRHRGVGHRRCRRRPRADRPRRRRAERLEAEADRSHDYELMMRAQAAKLHRLAGEDV